MSRRNACGELGVGDERVSLSYKDTHVSRLILPQPRPHTCRSLLDPIHRVAIEHFEHADVSLLERAFYKGPMCEQLVGEMTVEKDTFSAERSEERYTGRELVYKEDVVFRCCGRKEELCQGEMELPCMRKEDMEFAVPCTREGRDDVVYAEGTCERRGKGNETE
jgi:hypothetical protein